ncbi:MAG: response regulator [Clostridia bacterium]|nr:response regulator [Clostridia bacterium]MBT7121958.1 response regulator [Clostridia bacterium]
MTANTSKKYTVILADSCRDNMRNMRDYLSETGSYDILDFAFDGRQALELTKKHEPDLLIINLVMPSLDCFAVLEELAITERSRGTRVIGISATWLDFTLRKAQSLGVDYVMQKPFEKEYFQRRIGEVMQLKTNRTDVPSGGTYQNAKAIVTTLINTFGITANVKGYHYLRDAIVMVRKDFGLASKLTTDLYVQIADKYDTSPQCVERAIRHAIDSAWKRGDAATLRSFLGFADFVAKDKPSNGEVIAMLVNKLNTQLVYLEDGP